MIKINGMKYIQFKKLTYVTNSQLIFPTINEKIVVLFHIIQMYLLVTIIGLLPYTKIICTEGTGRYGYRYEVGNVSVKEKIAHGRILNFFFFMGGGVSVPKKTKGNN